MKNKKPKNTENDLNANLDKAPEKAQEEHLKKVEEFGGQEGPEPTRYGDWEKGGRCTDF